MDTITKTRTRCGSWRTFARRFRPVVSPSGTLHWSREQLPQDADARRFRRWFKNLDIFAANHHCARLTVPAGRFWRSGRS